MWFEFLFLILFFGVQISCQSNELTEKFFENLLEDHRATENLPLSSDVKSEIDKRINDYLMTLNVSDGSSNHHHRVKRNATEVPILVDKKFEESYTLKGFEKRGQIPVNFPLDLCLMKVNGTIYGAGLFEEKQKNGEQVTYKVLRVFYRKDRKFHPIHEYRSIFLRKMDCQATSDAGFIAVVNTVDAEMKNDVKKLIDVASLVFKIKNQTVEIFQRFSGIQQIGVKMWSRENDFFLVYTHRTTETSKTCTIYKLSNLHFDEYDVLPCENSEVIEFFVMYHQLYIFVGNSPTSNGSVTSYVLKHNGNTHKFAIYQRIVTESVVDCKYFYLDNQPMRQHYLIIANSGEDNTLMFYKFVNEFFIPIQNIVTDPIKSVLPVMSSKTKFYMFVAYEDHDVQIFEYNGWKFVESSNELTGEVFGKGANKIRAYDNIINSTITILIANQEIGGNFSNVYTPILKVKNDTHQFKESLNSWTMKTLQKVQEFDVEKVERQLNQSYSISSDAVDEAVFAGRIFLKNTSVQIVETKNLKSPTFSIDSNTIERTKQINSRIENISWKLKDITNQIRILKLQKRNRIKRQSDDDSTNEPLSFTDLIIDGNLNVQQINNRPFKNLIYKDNRKNAGKITQINADSVVVKKPLLVDGKLDEIRFSKDNLILNVPNQVFENVNVAKSIAAEKVVAGTVNGLSTDDLFSKISRKFSTKIPNEINELKCDSITIDQNINNMKFEKLVENALKITGQQVITGRMEINKLKGKQITFNSPTRLSNVDLNDLVLISNPSDITEEIFQDVRFSQDLLTINNLFVEERLNNINFVNGVASVLRKKFNGTQIVTGEKFFDEIILFGPINLQGKIKSTTLEKMNPITTINKDLVLDGDYRINGLTSIKRVLQSNQNILSTNENFNLKKLLDLGLMVDNSTKTVSSLNFKKPIQIKLNLAAIEINSKRTENFIKTDFPGIQFISGKKRFSGDFVVTGSCEAKIINGVDIPKLNQTVLKKFSAEPQFINGTIEFNQINVANLKTPNQTRDEIILGRRSYWDSIFSEDDLMLENMTITKPGATIPVKSLKVDTLISPAGSKVFNYDLNFLINDSITTTNVTSPIARKQFLSNLTVDQFFFADSNPMKNVIENFDKILESEFNYSGNANFAHEMSVKNLYFNGTINGVSVDDFSKMLLSETNQTFTAPQMLKSLSASKMLLLEEHINSKNITELAENTYWLSEDEIVATFKSDQLVYFTNLNTTIVNGIKNFEDQVILNRSNVVRRLKKLQVARSSLSNLTYNVINGIEIASLLQLLDRDTPANLISESSIIFQSQPKINVINDIDLVKLHQNVWLSNRNTILSGNQIQFQNPTVFNEKLRLEVLNGHNLKKFSSYISLSIPQKVNNVFHIQGTLYFKDVLKADKMILKGALKKDSSDDGIDIERFSERVLRNDIDQEIKGRFSFKRVILKGNLNVASINNLTLQDDVLKLQNLNSEIRGVKKFANINAGNILVNSINNIDLREWTSRAVYLFGEPQMIKGKVSLNKAIFFSNIRVQNTVNNMEFNENTILTKSRSNQVIQGNLILKTKFLSKNGGSRISTLSFHKLFLANGINGINFNQFYRDAYKVNDTEISSNLIFKRPLVIDNLETNGCSIYNVDMENLLTDMDYSTQLNKFEKTLRHLDDFGGELLASFADRAHLLLHFEFTQVISGNSFLKLLPIEINTADGQAEQVLVVLDEIPNIQETRSAMNFYKWDNVQSRFVLDRVILTPLDYRRNLDKLTRFKKIKFQEQEYFVIEIFEIDQNQYRQYLFGFDQQSKSIVSTRMSRQQESTDYFSLDPQNNTCLGSYNVNKPNIFLQCASTRDILAETSPIKMIVVLENLLIILNSDKNIEIWSGNEKKQIIQIPNPVCIATIAYKGKYYLAVCSSQMDQSVHHGSIEIFEALPDQKFHLVQIIHQKVATKIKFSILPTDDLLLYILTNDPTQPLLIYKYFGVKYFTEFSKYHSMISGATDIAAIQVFNELEFLAIVSKPNEITIIEAVMQKY